MEKKREGQERKKLWDIRNQEDFVRIIFVVMVIAQLGTIMYYFQFKKEGWHSDEMWSYGYANSYYQKDIFIDEDGNLMNYAEWTDSKVLWDYLVVNKGEEFEYGSVYQNQINDLSPPLHSMILHTICSFFPETFSLWYSFVINIFAFLVCIIYLFKTARLLKGDWFALCCCVVYGFSLAARDTYTYLRMYAMCTALVMVILYNLLVYMKADRQKLFNKNLIVISVTAFIGFLTHYYIITFVGILTFFVCIYYLFRKDIKRMFVFGGCQLVMLLLSIAVFPSLLMVAQDHNSAITEKTEALMNLNFDLRFRILIDYILIKLFGIKISLLPSGRLGRILVCLIAVIIWLIPLMYVLRETAFVKKLCRSIKFLLFKFKPILKWMLRRVNWYYVILAVVVLGQIIVVGETSEVYAMGEYIDRYLMYLYPIALILILGAVYQIIIIILKKKKYAKLITVIVSIVLVGVNIYTKNLYTGYLFSKNLEGEEISDNVENVSCIYIEPQKWLLTAMSPLLMNSEQFFMCSLNDYEEFVDSYKEKCEQGKVLLIIDTQFMMSAFEENESANIFVEDNGKKAALLELYENILAFFEDLEPGSNMEYVGTESVFERKMETYIINP